MQDRAAARNGSECINGWQYEWTGLTQPATVCDANAPGYYECGGAFPPQSWLRPDGVPSYTINGVSTMCINDASVYVKDGRVAMIESKGSEVEIELGEPIIGAEDFPDYDEILVGMPVNRNESGELLAHHGECTIFPSDPTAVP
jgi:hypothetical protein